MRLWTVVPRNDIMERGVEVRMMTEISICGQYGVMPLESNVFFEIVDWEVQKRPEGVALLEV